jgi:hypothetical protein
VETENAIRYLSSEFGVDNVVYEMMACRSPEFTPVIEQLPTLLPPKRQASHDYYGLTTSNSGYL